MQESLQKCLLAGVIVVPKMEGHQDQDPWAKSIVRVQCGIAAGAIDGFVTKSQSSADKSAANSK